MKNWLHSQLVKKIGITYPIIQAPMAGGATTPELVAAVSNAGGLGSLGAGYMAPVEIKQAIQTIRRLTNKPFAVNLFIPGKNEATQDQMQKACAVVNDACLELKTTIKPAIPPYGQSFGEQFDCVIEEKVPVFSYTFGTLDSDVLGKLQKNKTILMGTATTLAEAYALADNGADFIVAQGSEAGGHRGTFIGEAEDALIGLFSLIPQLVDHLKIPIVAAGGIMDGRGISAALDLGAVGVQMGTAFLTCVEAGIPDVYKQALLAKPNHTTLTRAFSGKMARGIPNLFCERLQQQQASILDYPIQNALTSPMRKIAKEQNNIEFMSMWAGQSLQLCRNTTAKALIATLVKETEKVKNA